LLTAAVVRGALRSEREKQGRRAWDQGGGAHAQGPTGKPAPGAAGGGAMPIALRSPGAGDAASAFFTGSSGGSGEGGAEA
jgi:hypothetical protein